MPKQMDFATAIFNKMMEKDYYCKWLGIEAIHIEAGHTKIRMMVRKDMLNGLGILHGGVAFSLADSALAFAANTYGRGAVTIQASINFAKSAKEGDLLIAATKPLHIGHKTADFDVNIYEEKSNEIYYRFRGTVYRTSQVITKQ